MTQLEQAKIGLNSTLVDNNTTVFLQATIRNFDAQIAEARNSACVVPKHILLRWKIEDQSNLLRMYVRLFLLPLLRYQYLLDKQIRYVVYN